MKNIYLSLTFTGFIIPYLFIINFLFFYGLDFNLMLNMMFNNPISSFFVWNFIIATIVLLIIIINTNYKNKLFKIFNLLLLFLIGVSAAIPFYFYCQYQLSK